jgi:type II secretory pathway pseudopilin PulG
MSAYRLAARGGPGDTTKIIMGTGGDRSAGFTIVETMIVLAVSAALAIMSLVYVAGRQNRTQFTVAVTGEKQYIEQTINETLNGFYPHTHKFTCNGSRSAAAPTFSGIDSAATVQGGNSGCTFLGKALAFGAGNSSTVAVYPLIGNQQFTTGGTTRDVESFTEAAPVTLGPGSASLPDLSTSTQLDNGLTLSKATYTYTDSTSTSYNYLGLLVLAYDLSQYSVDSGNNLGSAAQRLDLFTYPASGVLSLGSSSNPTSTALVAAMNTKVPVTSPGLKSVTLCFTSGGSKQLGLVTIAGQGALSVTEQIQETTTCP